MSYCKCFECSLSRTFQTEFGYTSEKLLGIQERQSAPQDAQLSIELGSENLEVEQQILVTLFKNPMIEPVGFGKSLRLI